MLVITSDMIYNDLGWCWRFINLVDGKWYSFDDAIYHSVYWGYYMFENRYIFECNSHITNISSGDLSNEEVLNLYPECFI